MKNVVLSELDMCRIRIALREQSLRAPHTADRGAVAADYDKLAREFEQFIGAEISGADHRGTAQDGCECGDCERVRLLLLNNEKTSDWLGVYSACLVSN